MFTRLYLPRAQLESLLGTAEIPWNTVYGQTTCTDAAGYNALRTDLLDCNYVSSISFTEDTTELFDNLIVSLGYVVVLIIICAAALAAVVLYNLISVNLGERKKELATIKVLGFYDQEVYRYIFREIELLALIGSGVGLAQVHCVDRGDGSAHVHPHHCSPQLPAGGGADHGVYRGGLLCDAAARPMHQHGGKHEGPGVMFTAHS